jgi:putative thioredoxin
VAASSEWVREATEADFDAEVIERSHETPVLVDFWAPWCGPCRVLGPVLEELAQQMQGRFVLVKVDTDAQPRLGTRFQIRSIPAVKLYVGGKVVDAFVGAQPGGFIRKLIERHAPDPVTEAVRAAQAKAAEDPAGARAEVEALVADAPAHVPARLAACRLALAAGDADAARTHAEAIDPGADEAELAARYVELAELARTCADEGGPAAVAAAVEAAPEDLDARFAYGCCLAGRGDYPAALEAWLEVVKRNPKHRDRAAHRAMVTLFGILPRDDDTRDAYQRQLQTYS